MKAAFSASPLFADMYEQEIEDCIKCSCAQVRGYEKNELIFNSLDTPTSVYVMIDGDILVCKDTLSGKRDIFLDVSKKGDVFGEVYLFMEKKTYEYYASALQKSTVLEIPKAYFYHTCEKNCTHHTKLIRNMMKILAQKAYRFNLKLQILASGTLRQKIIRYLLENRNGDQAVQMNMNRETFADFLNVARPSLSRELLKMEDEGIIKLEGRKIVIPDPAELENYL
jgi:CRP-like cAMP-binding protein